MPSRDCTPRALPRASRSGRHVGRWPPRNDKSENLAPLNLCRDHGLPRERPRNGKAEGFPHSSFFIFQSSGFIHSFPCPAPTANSPARHKKAPIFRSELMLALPIFPCSHPQSIVGANELNFCVRDGNRCTLTAINTNYLGTHPEN